MVVAYEGCNSEDIVTVAALQSKDIRFKPLAILKQKTNKTIKTARKKRMN